MYKTLIHELSKKVMDAYVQSLPMNQWYWPRFFPVKTSPTLQYTTLLGEKGAPVMADFISFGSTIPEKRREQVNKVFGEITKTAISRKMDESDYNDYLQLRRLSNASIDDILEYVYDDVDFCYRGVMARLEWLALQAISKGTVDLTNSNNEGPDTPSTVDFQVPSANKLVAQTAVWENNPGTAKPIQDLIYMHRTAKDNGHDPQRILMRQSDFYNFIAADEVKNTISPYLFSGQQTTTINLGVDQINMYLQSIGLPPISIVDQSVQSEIQGTRTAINPWEQYQVVMIPSIQLGQMLSAPQAEEGAIREMTESKRRNILIQKYSEVNPFAEFTKATTNSFIKFPRAMEVYMMDVNST